MNIPPSWAIALPVAGILGLLIAVAIRADGPPPWLGRAAYLVGGGLAGFLALAFAPAWPLLAFLGTLLIGMALRGQRPVDATLLITGFGATWTLMLGLAILNDLGDPAVHGSPGEIAWFVAGATILITGLTALLGLAIRHRG
jgi:hypothetical protein